MISGGRWWGAQAAEVRVIELFYGGADGVQVGADDVASGRGRGGGNGRWWRVCGNCDPGRVGETGRVKDLEFKVDWLQLVIQAPTVRLRHDKQSDSRF